MNQATQTHSCEEKQQLINVVVDLGFPREFGELLAAELGGPWSMRRMTGFLLSTRTRNVELIADELISILELRKSISNKIVAEKANAGWNEYLNRDYK